MEVRTEVGEQSPKPDKTDSVQKWREIAVNVFGSEKWEAKLQKITLHRPEIIGHLRTGVIDAGLELTEEQQASFKKYTDLAKKVRGMTAGKEPKTS